MISLIGKLQGDPPKGDNQSGLVQAPMFLIVGARCYHSWIGQNEVQHA